MGSLDAVVNMEAARDELQKAPNYLINPFKQHVYTINEAHVEAIQVAFPQHTVVYIGNEHGFKLSGIGSNIFDMNCKRTSTTPTPTKSSKQ